MSTKPPSINLLKREKQNFTDEFITWALSIGRLIIILTEVVALSAFLYRFSLDRRLIDLHERIAEKQTIIKLLQGNEEKFRNLQERIVKTEVLISSEEKTNKIFTDILGFVPKGMVINSFILNESSILMDTSAQSSSFLGIFIKKIKEYPNAKSISINRIENRTSSGTIEATININLKKSNYGKE